jgi:hypothetical protein
MLDDRLATHTRFAQFMTASLVAAKLERAITPMTSKIDVGGRHRLAMPLFRHGMALTRPSIDGGCYVSVIASVWRATQERLWDQKNRQAAILLLAEMLIATRFEGFLCKVQLCR